jgi:spore coat polysaccharide biosynthesis predicted glycosyltransferase SpsG
LCESKKITALVSVSKKVGTGNLRRVLSILDQAELMEAEIEIITIGDIDVARNCLSMRANKHKHYLDQTSLIPLKKFQNRVVIDLPDLSKDELQQIIQKCNSVIVFDDYFLRKLDVNNGFVISPNLHSSHHKLSNNYLYGELYLIIPAYKSIVLYRNLSQSYIGNRALFINFGGTDPLQLTTLILDWICQFGRGLIDSLVVVGGMQEDILPAIRGRLPVENFEYWQSLDPDEFIKKMSYSDYCIGSFGMGGWERLISRKPSLAFQVAENQQLALEYFQKNHLAVVVSHEKLFSNSLIAIDAGMREFFSKLSLPSWWKFDELMVDGLGVSRVAQLVSQQLRE